MSGPHRYEDAECIYCRGPIVRETTCVEMRPGTYSHKSCFVDHYGEDEAQRLVNNFQVRLGELWRPYRFEWLGFAPDLKDIKCDWGWVQEQHEAIMAANG